MTLPPAFQGWFARQGWQPHPHQLALLEAREDSLLIAPTGGGKTLAGFLPSLVDLSRGHQGLHTLYVSPLKALTADIGRNLARPVADLALPIRVEDRTGDTRSAARQRMREPCWPVAHARLADLVQRPVGVELLGCLDVVAPVGKEVRRVAQDDGGACAAGETRDVRATRIARRRVLGRMCVFGRDDVGVDLCVAHLGTQRGEARGRVGRLRTRLGRPGGKQRALLVHGAAGRGVRARGEATHGLIGGTPRGAHLHFYEDSRHGA